MEIISLCLNLIFNFYWWLVRGCLEKHCWRREHSFLFYVLRPISIFDWQILVLFLRASLMRRLDNFKQADFNCRLLRTFSMGYIDGIPNARQSCFCIIFNNNNNDNLFSCFWYKFYFAISWTFLRWGKGVSVRYKVQHRGGRKTKFEPHQQIR